MSVAYADTSVFVALAFREPSAASLRRRLGKFDRVVTSVFTEAELASALAREGVALAESPLRGAYLLAAPEPLSREIAQTLAIGYLRGADCWHLATALTYAPDRRLTFLTIDRAQREVAAAAGFGV